MRLIVEFQKRSAPFSNQRDGRRSIVIAPSVARTGNDARSAGAINDERRVVELAPVGGDDATVYPDARCDGGLEENRLERGEINLPSAFAAGERLDARIDSSPPDGVAR